MTQVTKSLAACLLRTAFATSLVLSWGLGMGSCTERPTVAPHASPPASSAAPRRRTPPQLERCADKVVVVKAPVCG
jgi:hypothetical protein